MRSTIVRRTGDTIQKKVKGKGAFDTRRAPVRLRLGACAGCLAHDPGRLAQLKF